jgi:hypothetical protein
MPKDERRQTERLQTAIPLTIEIVGTPIPPAPITVETEDISLRGLSLVIKIKTKSQDGRLSIQEGEDPKLVKYLMLDNKRLKMEIKILPQDKAISATGKVVWCYRNLRDDHYFVKVGISIEEMRREHKERWLEFLRAVYQFTAGLENGEEQGRERQRETFKIV